MTPHALKCASGPRAGETPFDLGDFRLHDFAHQHKGDEYDEVIKSRDTLTIEGKVGDGE